MIAAISFFWKYFYFMTLHFVTAIAELNGYFTCFQFDMERTLERQDDLKTLQIEYSTNLDVTNDVMIKFWILLRDYS